MHTAVFVNYVHYHLQQMGFKQVYSKCEYCKQIDNGFLILGLPIIRYKPKQRWYKLDASVLGHIQPCTCKHMNADVNIRQGL